MMCRSGLPLPSPAVVRGFKFHMGYEFSAFLFSDGPIRHPRKTSRLLKKVL